MLFLLFITGKAGCNRKHLSILKKKIRKTHTSISVIIAARNEEKNIGLCIDSILKQTYPAHLFEIIIVNDHSIDSTVAVVRFI